MFYPQLCDHLSVQRDRSNECCIKPCISPISAHAHSYSLNRLNVLNVPSVVQHNLLLPTTVHHYVNQRYPPTGPKSKSLCTPVVVEP